jgi:uncharacterized protein (DUF1684 family)
MAMPNNPFTLAHWRHSVAEIYAAVRLTSEEEPTEAWNLFRARRDRLFQSHEQSPLTPAQREGFSGLHYYPYDPTWRVQGTLDRNVDQEVFSVELPAEGALRLTRVAQVHFPAGDQEATLAVFWIAGYGGGLFLPFRDAACGQGSYGGGRYLYDTIKGADLGAGEDKLLLDFNYAYNPSCAYNEQWVCPLAPQENWLPLEIRAGERSFGP